MTPLEGETLTLKAIVGRYMDNRQAATAELDELQLRPEDFSQKPAQALCSAVLAAISEGKPLDVVEMVRATHGLAPQAWVADVVADFHFVEGDHMRSRVSRLRDFGQRRRISDALRGLLEKLKADITTDACLGELETISRSFTSQRGAQTLESSLMSLGEKLNAVQNGERQPVLPTGIEALDYAIGGLSQTLTIIGALPGVGKSALLVSVVRNLAAKGLKVGVLSLEDERDWLTERILAEAAAVPLFVLGNKPLTTGQKQRVEDCSGAVYELLKNILVDDSPAMSPAEVVSTARSMIARGCRAVVVDHLGEIRLDRSERHDLDVQEALQDLRGIAKRYHVPVVVACHLRRREGLNVDSVPRLTDFAFSASIERCARVALGLFRPKGDAPGDSPIGVEVLKQTKGPAGFNFKLDVGKLYGTVVDTPPSKAMREQFSAWREQ